MKKLTLLLIVAFVYVTAHTQTASVKGVINDTINKQNLSNTVVALLRIKDSVLYKFTRSDKSGNFVIKNIAAGSYVLMATENTYADFLQALSIADTSVINMGIVPMTLRANMLQEVIVRQQVAAMRMKGDTLEFAADSFKVREGASVEEMLRKLPGVQIDKDGKITAQGEEVKKVLVDGEEFFGDDPTIATRGLQADAIDKVQVFDKKSDQATFTGIDDGEKEKTINLKLKANKKKGYFGKMDLAGDFKERWNNTAMINNFKNKTKLSAYGIMSSTGKTGLDWEERDKYGGGNNIQYDEDNGYFFSFNNDDDLNSSSFYGEGIPKSWSGGINLSNKFSDDQNINGSYRYNKLNTLGEGRTISQSLLPNNFFINRDSGNNFSSKQRNSVNINYENKFDTTASIKFIGSGYTGTTLGRSIYNSSLTNEKGVQVNNSRRNTYSSGDNQNLNINLLLRKKFKKAGRTLSLSIADIYNASNTQGQLNALVNFYDDSLGTFIRDSITDQRKENMSRINNFSSKITYTEPLTKKLYAEINYGLSSNTSTSKKLSYDKGSDDKYEDLNPVYSNHYEFNVFTNTAGAALRYNGKHLTASAGSDVGFTNFDQKDIMHDTVYSRDYTNLFPRANITYKFKGNTRLSITYNGSTQQPQITQIQPIKDNTNPLVQTIGNPDLKQAFNHRINFNFNTYDVLKQRGFYMWSGFTTTSNAIVTDQTTDVNTGVTTLRYVNRTGNYNYYGSGGYNLKFKKLNTYASLGFELNGSKYSNVVNGVNNITYNNAPGVRIYLGKDKEKKYNLSYQGSFTYNFSKSSVQQNITTNYWTQEHNVTANVTLPWKMEVNSDVQFLLRQKTDLFTNDNNVVLWNAYFGRRLLKNDKAIIKIQANDLLNQNKGYSRSISSNTLTETNYQTIRCYFQLAFSWSFSKSAAGTAAPQQ